MLKIALLAPFEESVPPKKYGGTEVIVAHLANELTKRGHKVYLFATQDSKTKANLIPIFKRAIRKEKFSQNLQIREAMKYIGVSKILKHLKDLDIDLIHNHLGWRFLPFADLIKKPVLTTLHGPLNISYQQFVYKKFKNFPFVSISNSQRKFLPSLNFVATVYNGIDLKIHNFNPSIKKENYLAFLGRMSPEKGPLEAIQIAKLAKRPLKMAAKIDVVDKSYFETKIKPLIDGKEIQYLGEISQKEKVKFLQKAIALLAPLQWEEPFGLYMAEAMACGTPVIAFNRGSAKELIKDEKTGFIVKNVKEAALALKKINQIQPKDCRQWVEKNFSKEKMVENYEKVYLKILKSNFS